MSFLKQGAAAAYAVVVIVDNLMIIYAGRQLKIVQSRVVKSVAVHSGNMISYLIIKSPLSLSNN